jgi:hypothetical protein
MDSWWQLGEHSGYSGDELALFRITCPFCEERGNFDTVRHAEKKKPNGAKTLNFDTLECGSCKGYVMCLWSAGSSGLHDYRVLPWPMRVEKHPEHWPADVGRFWLQAHRSLADENWDAAAVMARSALQASLREQKAAGANLKQEIADLASRGLLPPLIKEWSDTLRELGNDSAHPKPGQAPTDPKDARDVTQFLDFLLEYLYSLPHRIEQYRAREAGGGKRAPAPRARRT